MAFTPWRKNKQIMIDDAQEHDRIESRNAVQQSHPDHQVNNGSTGFGFVNADRPTFININRLRLFGRRGSSSNSTTAAQETENEPIDSNIDCTLRLGCPTEPPSKPQQQPQGGDDNLSAVINNYFPPNNVVPQELMQQDYEVMNGNERRTPLYHQHSQHNSINNRFGMNNFNPNNYQLQQQIMNNNNMVVANHGVGSPSIMNIGGYMSNNSSSDTNMIANNNGMFHTGDSPSTMNVVGNGNSNNNHIVTNNYGMFHGGGNPYTMTVGGNNSRNNSNTFFINNNGMLHGGGSPSSTINIGANGNTNSHPMFNNSGMFHGGGRSYTMNAGVNSSSMDGNNFRMFHGGRGGGGDLSSVVAALPSPGVGPVGDGFNGYNIPYPLPPQPPNNFHVPFPNNNIPPPFPAPQLPPAAPAAFLAAPRRNEPYHYNYPPQPYPPQQETPKRCFACRTIRTPLWRNGPKGPKSLCNACGIRYKKEVRRIMGVMAPDGGQPDKKNKF